MVISSRYVRYGRWMLFLCLLVWCAAAGCRSQQSDDIDSANMNLDSLLAGVRTAVGYDTLPEGGAGIVLDATGTSTGVDSEFHIILLRDGRFRAECSSSLGWIWASTGTEGYRVDYTGMSYPLEHWSLEVKTLTAWVLGHYWLDPDAPLELHPVEAKTQPGQLGVGACMPGGAVEAQIWIDPRTFLPQSMSWSIYGDENLLELTDYGIHDGVAYPHHIRITADGDVTDIRVSAISEAGESAINTVGTVAPPADDTYFNLGIPATVPSALTNRGLLVKPNVDGRDDAWFILDTGTSCNVTWTVNVNGTAGTKWLFFAYFNGSYAETGKFNVTITGTGGGSDTTAPTVNAITPANGSSWTSSSTVTFTYNVSDATGIENCSLLIDGAVDQSSSSITNNV